MINLKKLVIDTWVGTAQTSLRNVQVATKSTFYFNMYLPVVPTFFCTNVVGSLGIYIILRNTSRYIDKNTLLILLISKNILFFPIRKNSSLFPQILKECSSSTKKKTSKKKHVEKKSMNNLFSIPLKLYFPFLFYVPLILFCIPIQLLM